MSSPSMSPDSMVGHTDHVPKANFSNEEIHFALVS
jgi:hypothetical protein